MNEPQEQTGSRDIKVETAEPLLLSTDEQRVLDLFEQLLALEVKIALAKAQQAYSPNPSAPDSDDAVRKAQDEASKSRASWMLRNDITNSVMTANPILKAVHNGTHATPVEMDLLPYIKQRDDVSVTLARQSTELQIILSELTKNQSESLRIGRHNMQLTTELLQLADDANRKKTGVIGDPGVQSELERLQGQVKASRQKWKVMKGTASAVVVGSGVDWVADEALRDIVLDVEDEG